MMTKQIIKTGTNLSNLKLISYTKQKCKEFTPNAISLFTKSHSKKKSHSYEMIKLNR